MFVVRSLTLKSRRPLGLLSRGLATATERLRRPEAHGSLPRSRCSPEPCDRQREREGEARLYVCVGACAGARRLPPRWQRSAGGGCGGGGQGLRRIDDTARLAPLKPGKDASAVSDARVPRQRLAAVPHYPGADFISRAVYIVA
jgi:hypothetical protein